MFTLFSENMELIYLHVNMIILFVNIYLYYFRKEILQDWSFNCSIVFFNFSFTYYTIYNVI